MLFITSFEKSIIEMFFHVFRVSACPSSVTHNCTYITNPRLLDFSKLPLIFFSAIYELGEFLSNSQAVLPFLQQPSLSIKSLLCCCCYNVFSILAFKKGLLTQKLEFQDIDRKLIKKCICINQAELFGSICNQRGKESRSNKMSLLS